MFERRQHHQCDRSQKEPPTTKFTETPMTGVTCVTWPRKGIDDRRHAHSSYGTTVGLLVSTLVGTAKSGMDNEGWADSMECYCFLRNIQDLLSDEKTPCERRFGMPFNGPATPFGAVVEYHPFFCPKPVETPPIRSESLTWNVPRLCVVCGVNLERRHFGRRH